MRIRCALARVVVVLIALIGCRGSGPDPTILLFGGTGTPPNDVTADKRILADNGLDYSAVNSSQLNSMSESQMRAYRLLIIPGGAALDADHAYAGTLIHAALNRNSLSTEYLRLILSELALLIRRQHLKNC
jgi:hypothetical protein